MHAGALLRAGSLCARAAIRSTISGVAAVPCRCSHVDATSPLVPSPKNVKEGKGMPRKRAADSVDEEVEEELAVKELETLTPEEEELDAALGPLIAPAVPRAPVLERAVFDDGLAAGLQSAGARGSASEGKESSGLLGTESAAAELQDFADTRKAIMSHMDTLRRFDAFALGLAAKASSSSTGLSASATYAPADLDAASGGDSKALPEAGPPVDYCLFCAHGVYGVLRPDNTALLSRLVSERGSILPKRFTHCCAKHQRKLAATLRRARSLNYIPFHSKLHPRLRFGGMSPALPTAAGAGARVAGGRGVGLEGLGRTASAVEILAGLNPSGGSATA